MIANGENEQTDLIEAALEQLRSFLPDTWEVQLAERESQAASAQPAWRPDAKFELRTPNATHVSLIVEARQAFPPREAAGLLTGLSRVLREAAWNPPVLVVAPWLSPRTRELLAADEINYIDLTGNALLRLDNPTVYIRSDGARRDPAPAPERRVRVRGPKAMRLVRLLLDVQPPYAVGELAAAGDLNPGYVSQLLEALDREALIERSRRGSVEAVDVAGLVRRWAESYDLLKTNKAQAFLAPQGPADALARIAAAPAAAAPVVVTGSFAAVRYAPVAAPVLLAAYCAAPAELAARLDLLPADAGANVVLLKPYDQVVFGRTSEEGGLRFAGPPQIAVDCLTGTGRMPAEGEAMVSWMTAEEARWRLGSLADLEQGGEP